jgi:hypothetical protein
MTKGLCEKLTNDGAIYNAETAALIKVGVVVIHNVWEDMTETFSVDGIEYDAEEVEYIGGKKGLWLPAHNIKVWFE